MDWAVFTHNPDGDMGYGACIGRFRSQDAAQAKADAIMRAAQRRSDTTEAFVVEMWPTSVGAAMISERVQ